MDLHTLETHPDEALLEEVPRPKITTKEETIAEKSDDDDEMETYEAYHDIVDESLIAAMRKREILKRRQIKL